MNAITFCCVLRSGGGFGPEYVDQLYRGVREHWTGPLDFLAVTDTPLGIAGVREHEMIGDWPGVWCKMALYDPAITGPLLYFDLDVIVTGPLAEIQQERRLSILRSFRRKKANRCNSSVLVLPEAMRKIVWRKWDQDPAQWMEEYAHAADYPRVRHARDEGVILDAWEEQGIEPLRLQDQFPNQFASFSQWKNRTVPRKDIRVVVFYRQKTGTEEEKAKWKRPGDLGWKLPK